MAAGEVEVNRRLFQIAVTEQQLDGAQVRSRFQQVRGKTMSQSVRVNPFFQAGTLGGRRTGVPDGGGDDGFRSVMPAPSREKPYLGLELAPVLAQGLQQDGAQHDLPIFAAFATLDVHDHAFRYPGL